MQKWKRMRKGVKRAMIGSLSVRKMMPLLLGNTAVRRSWFQGKCMEFSVE